MNMKVSKAFEKEYLKKIKMKAKEYGYKCSSYALYKKENEKLIVVYFMFVNSEKLLYRVNVKPWTYDDIFWKIMKMEENKNEKESIRVNGAFAAPVIFIEKKEIELSEDIDSIVECFIEKMTGIISDFLKENTLSDYVFKHNEIMDASILQCLSHIENGDMEKAIKLAEEEISKGNKGRFINQGKGFFELLLSMEQ